MHPTLDGELLLSPHTRPVAAAFRAMGLTLLMVTTALWPSGVAAATGPIQTVDSIRAAAAAHLEEESLAPGIETQIIVGNLDSRLRLPRCGAPMETFVPPGRGRSGRVSVGVKCAGPKPWTLYVPAQIKEFREVMVIASPLRRGEIVTARHLEIAVRDVAGLSADYLVEAAEAIGQQANRHLRAGEPVSRRNLRPARLVRRGETVTIVARAGTFEVRSQGKALQDGARGERITVRNQRSRRVVEAVVTRAGIVVIPL